ncbi:hypothetical protein CTI12_AA489420 [Artemisia annua]|uniref:Uncharacterized protein n=1 Tax=Artemisia annua TaxID=35608 RepID=A0A2U1LIB0_ARTAN|nr:hypothetical protein CTI12_AA489420 [Artemisia annua]
MDIGSIEQHRDPVCVLSGSEFSVTRHLEKVHDPADIMWVELGRHQKSNMLMTVYFHNAEKPKGNRNT